MNPTEPGRISAGTCTHYWSTFICFLCRFYFLRRQHFHDSSNHSPVLHPDSIYHNKLETEVKQTIIYVCGSLLLFHTLLAALTSIRCSLLSQSIVGYFEFTMQGRTFSLNPRECLMFHRGNDSSHKELKITFHIC